MFVQSVGAKRKTAVQVFSTHTLEFSGECLEPFKGVYFTTGFPVI